MITIISGTNRPHSRTLQVAQHYFKLLQSKNIDVKLYSLEEFKSYNRDADVLTLENDLLKPSEKFIIIMPEYNGSFPGILKALLDVTDIRSVWWYKKAMLVGVADGRGGNLRGIEHMTNILHYLRMNVFYNKLPLSRINQEMDENGIFLEEMTVKAIAAQVNDFIDY